MAPEREDDFLADLWLAGTQGAQTHETPAGLEIEAWFAPGAPPLPPSPGVEPLAEDLVPDRDWLASYRELARPFPVGRSFWLDPREPEATTPPDAPSGRRLLRLPARAAFGTGSHESTALALELLEATAVAGRRVLDVGTGTGVLAFAARLLGAAAVVAFDLDPAAPFHARDNARLNGLPLHLFAGRLGALSARFDLALVNVVPEQILPEAPALVHLLAPAAEAVFSGILLDRASEVLAALAALGLSERDRRTSGEWIAFRVGR